MKSKIHLQKAKNSARNTVIVVAVCLEVTFLFLAFLTHTFFISTPLSVLAFLMVIGVPFAAVYEWRKQSQAPRFCFVSPIAHELPHVVKMKAFGAQLALEQDRMCWSSKQRFEKREVAYNDIQTIELTCHGAYILVLKRESSKLSLRLNLSLFDKKDWPFIVKTIADRAPKARLDELAQKIREGHIPKF